MLIYFLGKTEIAGSLRLEKIGNEPAVFTQELTDENSPMFLEFKAEVEETVN